MCGYFFKTAIAATLQGVLTTVLSSLEFFRSHSKGVPPGPSPGSPMSWETCSTWETRVIGHSVPLPHLRGPSGEPTMVSTPTGSFSLSPTSASQWPSPARGQRAIGCSPSKSASWALCSGEAGEEAWRGPASPRVLTLVTWENVCSSFKFCFFF